MPTASLCMVREMSGSFCPQVVIGLLPCKDRTHLRFGGWDDCPDPHIHVAHRMAILVGLGKSMLMRPPTQEITKWAPLSYQFTSSRIRPLVLTITILSLSPGVIPSRLMTSHRSPRSITTRGDRSSVYSLP